MERWSRDPSVECCSAPRTRLQRDKFLPDQSLMKFRRRSAAFLAAAAALFAAASAVLAADFSLRVYAAFLAAVRRLRVVAAFRPAVLRRRVVAALRPVALRFRVAAALRAALLRLFDVRVDLVAMESPRLKCSRRVSVCSGRYPTPGCFIMATTTPRPALRSSRRARSAGRW
jgi:hypothetical protein